MPAPLDLDAWEDNAYLVDFYERSPGEWDPRQRFVVRLRYVGGDPSRASRDWVEEGLLERLLHFPREDVLAVIQLPGMGEIDICFRSEQAFQQFWALTRAAVRVDPTCLSDFALIPLFWGETHVVTVFFRTTAIPEEDLALCLEWQCRILQPPERKYDHQGYWTEEFWLIVSLERDPWTGRLQHLPRYFFLGAERRVLHYSGQPPACFQCRGFDHYRKNCASELCSRCGVRGHWTTLCMRPVTCSLCTQQGHPYRLCPQSVINVRNPEAFQRELIRAELWRQREEAAREQERRWREADRLW